MTCGDFQDLPRRTVADEVLRDKAFETAKNPKYDLYQREIDSMVYRCFDKNFPGSGFKSGIMSNQEIAEELHKPVIRKIEKGRKVLKKLFLVLM